MMMTTTFMTSEKNLLTFLHFKMKLALATLHYIYVQKDSLCRRT